MVSDHFLVVYLLTLRVRNLVLPGSAAMGRTRTCWSTLPIVPVVAGAHGGGFHFLGYERTDRNDRAEHKLCPYRRMAQLGRALPVLFVCESTLTENHLLAVDDLPLLTTTMPQSLAGPLTGAAPPGIWWQCIANSGGDGGNTTTAHRRLRD